METRFPGESFDSSFSNFSESDITNAKLDELNKSKTHKVYDIVYSCNEKFIDLRCFFSEKYVNGELNVKTKLVSKGFQNDNSDILNDSSTCSNKSMCFINIIVSSKWLCWSIDIKSAFI